ncbi:MAG: sigma-54-dependent Fis family transcriptional regulator [Ignavibacteriae bacterium]|nr:sigma-54-dependent Fis family transcriptional regulator [Ignavibacteriota bacterium]
MMAKILVVDDDAQVRELLNVNLKGLGHNVILAETGTEGFEFVEKTNPDLVICDLILPDANGIKILENIKEFNPRIQVILITAYYNMSSIIQAMQKGSFDYMQKPLDFDQLRIKIKRALEIQMVSEQLDAYRAEDSEEYQIENSLIGRSPSIREIGKYIGQLSSNRVSVLVQGNSGTGKELVTKIIHFTGITKEQPFVAINCSAISENLLESELFGHVKGAFTGAIKNKKGKFELAREGTIFLDEIAELSISLQAKLLRVLQEREFEKVGGENTYPMKARIIAASNRNLENLVKEGKFREDLYYRLRVFTIDIPALKERKEDIPLLVVHFLKKINKEIHKNVKKIPIESMEKLQFHNWPGNIRELENTLMQAIVLSKSDVLVPDNILINPLNNEVDDSFETNLSLFEVEKRHIRNVLDSVNGDKVKAIAILGISKPTLYSKLEKYNISQTTNFKLPQS